MLNALYIVMTMGLLLSGFLFLLMLPIALVIWLFGKIGVHFSAGATSAKHERSVKTQVYEALWDVRNRFWK